MASIGNGKVPKNMQDIIDRIKLNQEELSRLRNLNFKSSNKDSISENEAPTEKNTERNLVLDFLQLKKQVSTRKNSKKIEKEFKKLEKSLVRENYLCQGDSVSQKSDLDSSFSLEILKLKKEKEILLQKLEIQKVLKEFQNLGLAAPTLSLEGLSVNHGENSLQQRSYQEEDTPTVRHLPVINSLENAQVLHSDFKIEKGFYGYIESIIGLPKYLDDYNTSCTFGVFEGAESRGDLLFISGKKNLEGLATLNRDFSLIEVMPIRNYRLILEFRAQDPNSRNLRDVVLIGWTCIDLFNDKFQPDYGKWMLPVFRPPLDFNISTNHLYSTGQAVTGVHVVFHLVDKLKKYFKGDKRPFDEKANAEFKRYPFAVKGLEYYANGEKPKKKAAVRKEQVVQNVKPGQNIVQSAISTNRNLKDLVSELINIELNLDKRAKKAWKAGDNSDLKKAGIGFQIEEIRNLLPTESLPRIRFKFAEVFEEVVEFDSDPTHTILTEEAEPGLDDSSYGFPSQAFVELHDLALSPFKRVYIEILDGAAVVASVEFPLCKEVGQSLELNEGGHSLSLTRRTGTDMVGGASGRATLSMNIYNPINGRPEEFKFASKVGTKPIPEGAWISVVNNPPLGRENQFRPGDGIAIYIDAARYLPENVGPTKVVFRVLNQSKKVSKSDYQTKLDLEEALCNPEYKYSTVFQNYYLDSTAVVLFKVFTLLEDGSKAVVGYSSIQLLLPDPENKKDRKSAYFVNEGGHQIPLQLSSDPSEGKLRMPCSSLLIRLMRIPADKMNDADVLKSQSFPRYSDRIYDSSRCVPQVYEERLFYYVFTERKVVQVKEKLTEKDTIQSVSKRLPGNFDDECPLIDRSFVVSYDSNAGFRISIDMVIDCPSKFPTFASLLLISTLERSDSDFKGITKLDYNSGVKSFRFLDGFQWYRWNKYDPNLFVVIQLVQIDVANNSIIPDGWTVLPIFNLGTNYVSLGNFQLPLIKGQYTKPMIGRMRKRGVDEALLDLIDDRQIRLNKGCVNIRLCDGRRMEEVPADAPVQSNEISELFGYRPIYKIPSSSPVTSLIPKSSSRADFEAKTVKIFNDVSINHNSYI